MIDKSVFNDRDTSDVEPSTTRLAVGDIDVPVVTINDLVDNSEPESGVPSAVE